MIDLSGKTILYRSPYDIKPGGDDSRIKATLPTLQKLLEQNCKIVIITWAGRPEGKDESLSTKWHAQTLSKLLNHPVEHINDCIGKEVQEKISAMKAKDILMLENTRFYKEDYENNPEFAKKLAEGKGVIVFDGFPQAHREVSSTLGILELLPAVAGEYFKKEIKALSNLTKKPAKPFTLVIGGAKVSDKIEAISNLLDKTDYILAGGGPANVFLATLGYDLKASLLETKEAEADKANQIEEHANKVLDSGKLNVPLDLVFAKSKDNSHKPVEPIEAQAVAIEDIKKLPQNSSALDIGPETSTNYAETIRTSKTVLWAGPMGLFEKKEFSQGTQDIVQAINETEAETIIAGGDTISALKELGNPDNVTHISLAGGATLEFLAGKKMPVIEKLKQGLQN